MHVVGKKLIPFENFLQKPESNEIILNDILNCVDAEYKKHVNVFIC